MSDQTVRCDMSINANAMRCHQFLFFYKFDSIIVWKKGPNLGLPWSLHNLWNGTKLAISLRAKYFYSSAGYFSCCQSHFQAQLWLILSGLNCFNFTCCAPFWKIVTNILQNDTIFLLSWESTTRDTLFLSSI